MARAIDANELLGIERLLDTDVVRQSKTASWLLDQVLHDIQAMPTLTPPNEWVSVEERRPDKHDEYIVCACDEGEPIDERIWGDTVVVFADYYDGTFTWYEGNTEYDISDIVTHWMHLPAPPDRRPPEGEEDA